MRPQLSISMADQVWKFIEDNYDDFEDALKGND